MSMIRSIMAAREEYQDKLREYQNGKSVTFDREQWLYMLNHGQANRTECEILWQDAESIHVRKSYIPARKPYDPNRIVRTMRFNPKTGRMECVWEGTISDAIARDKARRKTRLSVSK